MAGEILHQDLTLRLSEGLSVIAGAFTGQPPDTAVRANVKAGVPLGYIPDHKPGGVPTVQPMVNNNFSNRYHFG